MLGPPKVCCLDQPVTVSLEELVAPDHFYRHLAATLDLSFVRDWVADCYAVRGRPSIDPIVFFKPRSTQYPYCRHPARRGHGGGR